MNFRNSGSLAKWGVVFVLLLGLTGCFDKPRLAPVINAWYQPNAKNTYLVRQGDTIYSIAWAFGLDYRALAKANHLKAPYEITVGEHLRMTTIARGHATRSFSPAMTDQAVEAHQPIATTTSHALLSKGYLQWRWPTKGRLVERFTPNITGSQGIYIAGRWGQPVLAAAGGEVVYSGDGVRGYDNLIIIKHNRQFLSAYAFNQRNLVKVGDIVQAGSVIARMGRNNAGQTLLYFEIRRDGRPVNPLQFLR